MNTNEIALTERAASHIKKYLAAEQSSDVKLRVGVKPTGCSGYQYVVEATDDINDSDEQFESRGIKIIVDNLSMKYLSGTELDYVKEGLNEGFQFNNPNVQATCGCGESFTVSEEENS